MQWLKKSKTLSTKVNSLVFTFLLSLYFVCIINLPVLARAVKILQGLDPVDLGFALSIPLLFVFSLNLLFTPFSIKYFEKPFFITLTLVSSVLSYALYHYGVVFDFNMIDNIFKSNKSEIFSYLNKDLFFWFFLVGIIPSLLISKIKIIHVSFMKDVASKLLMALISIVMIALIAMVYYKDYAPVKRNNSDLNKMIVPIYFTHNLYKYINKRYFTAPPVYKPIGLDAKNKNGYLDPLDHKNSLLIFVVGETARSMNYQLNGYEKETNQHTQRLGMISFKQVTACGTNTAISLPCLFSNLSRKNYSAIQAENQDNLLDILKRAGVNVLWVDNNAGCYQVCKNVATIHTNPKDRPWCDGHSCVDEALLVDLQKQIDGFKGRDSVIFLHLLGSHGPAYYKRFPKQHEHFQPGCLRSDIQNCTRQELLNTYDNSILYTDFVLSEIIKILDKNRASWHTSLLYLSDHGESLGENGLYLHGFPYSLAPVEQTHVPYLAWFSDSFIKNKKIDPACLKKKAASEHYSHDNIFSSVLGLMDIETDAYQKKEDMFSCCHTTD